MKKYSKKVLAASSVITVLANNITIANASELITSNDEFNKSVLLENHQSTGKKIYVKQIHDGVENGSESNPYKSFSTAYEQAKDGDTIVLNGNVTILGQGSDGAAPFICKKNITIEGMEGTDATLNSRTSFQLEADVVLKNFAWSFPGVSVDNRGIFLNGHKLVMNNVSVESSTEKSWPTVYGSSSESINNNDSELVVDNTTGKNTIFENIYTGSYTGNYTGNVTLKLNSGVKILEDIYANGVNGGVNGNINISIGNIFANSFKKASNLGQANLTLNNYNGMAGTTILGFKDITLNNSSIKINDESNFDEVNGSLSLLGDSKLDISSKTNTLDIKGDLLGENSSKIIFSKSGSINVEGALNGTLELRTEGNDAQTSGMILVDHKYISASNNSTGQVMFKPYWNQTMYELKCENADNKKQWITRVTDKPKLDKVEIKGENRIDLSNYREEVYNLVFKDINDNLLEYTPIFDYKILGVDGQEVSEDDMYFEVLEMQNEMIIGIDNPNLPVGDYKIILTDTLTGKEFIYVIKLYNNEESVVTFDFNGGHQKDNVDINKAYFSVGKDTLINKIDDPIRNGYTFEGWYTDTNFTTEWDFENDSVKEDDITLYAKWTKNSYDVVFNSQGGSEVKGQSAKFDEKIEKPQEPTKAGYTFAGWYKEQQCENPWDFETDKVPAHNVTLYAKWTKNSYDVVFNSQGGSEVKGQSAKFDEKIEKPQEPTKAGYTFAGWYKEQQCENPWDFETDKVPAHNVTLYAKWILNSTELNHAPTIKAEDKVLQVGDEFNPLAGVTAEDDEDGKIVLTEANIIKNTVNMKEAGTYEVTYKITDSKGASAVKTITVTVNPRIEQLNKVPTIKAEDKVLQVGDEFNPLAGVTAEDDEDGKIVLTEANIIKNTVNMKEAGTYEVTYKITDSKGASAVKTITVTVNPRIEQLNKVPTIKAEDKVLQVGDEFNPLAGVTAEDDEDGKIVLTEANIIKNTVNMKEAGTYEVTYKVTDSKGASAIKTITVIVKKGSSLAQSITINNKINSLYVGSNKVFTAIVNAEADIQEVEWSVNNESIASIEVTGNSVKVTAKAKGQVTITAKTKDGSNKIDTFTINIEEYENNVVDFVTNIIDTNVVSAITGSGEKESPLNSHTQWVF